MKGLKEFKILFDYLKKDRFKFICYVILMILINLGPVLSSVIWAIAFEKLCNGMTNEFIIFLILWSSIMLIAWSILKVPYDILYNYLEKKFIEKVSIDLYKKINDLPAVAFEDIGSGEFVNRMYSDPEKILELLNKLIRLTCRLIIAIVIVIITFFISYILGLELILLGIVMFILSQIYYPKIKKIQEKIKKESDNYLNVSTQNISGIREIKALGIKENINKNVSKIVKELFNNQRKIGKTESVYYAIINGLYLLIQFVILLTLGLEVINGLISISTFILIESYIWRIDDVVENLSEFGVSYNKIKVSLKRINEIINNKLYEDEKFGDKELDEKDINIKFNNVKFKYHEKDELTLKGLNLDLKPNKKIAIVGKSGQGKTTIFNLLLRYFDVTEGKIELNGIDIRDLSEKSLRENISIIRQDPYLFNKSIFDNFKIVKDDVTLEEVRDVCKKAYIDDYIMSLPDKYDTLIGEGGINLSGGQKQRIAIARTLLKNTRVILFDEATSALDNNSQEYIKQTIDDLVKTHTVIIVAHRLSTIMDANIIYIIDDGKNMACGTHKELIKKCELYRNLYSPETFEI